jgi:hypothetical protein
MIIILSRLAEMGFKAKHYDKICGEALDLLVARSGGLVKSSGVI